MRLVMERKQEARDASEMNLVLVLCFEPTDAPTGTHKCQHQLQISFCAFTKARICTESA